MLFSSENNYFTVYVQYSKLGFGSVDSVYPGFCALKGSEITSHYLCTKWYTTSFFEVGYRHLTEHGRNYGKRLVLIF
jgi:hypothetical protein